jgi:hypothetical protein
MARSRRDSSKAPENVDLPAAKPRKRPLADRATSSDFGDLQTRPSPPSQPEPSGRKLLADSGPSEEVDLPSPFSFSIDGEKPR